MGNPEVRRKCNDFFYTHPYLNIKRQHYFTLTLAINRTGYTVGQFYYFRTEHQLLPIRPFKQAKIQTTKTALNEEHRSKEYFLGYKL